MRALALRLLPISLALFATVAVAASDTPSSDKMTGFKMPVRAGVNFGVGSNSSSDMRITFAGGLGAEYFFVPNVGVFVGADYMSRGYKTSLVSISATYIDIPFGIAFQYRGAFGGDAINTLKLGGFAAVALDSTFSGAAGTLPAKTFFGITLEGMTLFPISDTFSLGVATWFKYGISAATTSGGIDRKFLDFGLGLGARFF